MLPFCLQILFHHAAAHKVFFRHAFLAMDTLSRVDVIARVRDMNRTRLAHALAFKALATGVEFSDLVADLPL